MVAPPQVHDSSMPLTHCMPKAWVAARASRWPSRVSWSVNESIRTPCSWARATRTVGVKAPSEAVL
ncbi:hypothetical protein D3C72_1876480 [compost metagenome]